MPDEGKFSPLHAHGLKLAEAVRNHYCVTVPAGTSTDDIAKPEFWSHVARMMRQGDKIEVLAADASWYAELRVMEVGQGGYHGARVAFTAGPVTLENKNAIASLNDYQTKASANGWAVVRYGTDEVVKDHLPDRKSADRWIASHRKAMAA